MHATATTDATTVGVETGPDSAARHRTRLDPDDELPVWDVADGASLLAGRLALDRLGVGLRCETWLVWSVPMWCPAVVKLARPHQVTHPRAVISLGREVAALGGALHAGLPRLLGDGRADAIPNVTFEYVDGPTLDEALDDGPLGSTDAALLAVQLLSALACVHDRGLAHVDLKPENVVVRDGRPVVVDFGSARAIGAEQPAGRPIGTPGYAAPELEAGAPISAAMDLYGIGTILFEALSASAPFEPGPAHLRPPPPPLPAGVPPKLAALVRAMLEPDPADRPGRAELMQALAAGIDDQRRRPWPAWADAHLADRFDAFGR